MTDATRNDPAPSEDGDEFLDLLEDHLERLGTSRGDVVGGVVEQDIRAQLAAAGLEKDYEVEATSSPGGVTHVTFTRAVV